MFCQNISTICNLYLILTTIIIKTATINNTTSESCRSYYSREINPSQQSEAIQLNIPRTNEHVSSRFSDRYYKYGSENFCQYVCSWLEHNVCKKMWFVIGCLGTVILILGFIAIYLTVTKVRVCGGWYNYIFDLCLLPHLNPTEQTP
ncbi:hypothetical protein NBO_3g0046 [Nosema bombycis CQ1]|uniref:Uncharacterized protein n=1 Tax=Nosema bombycis (strain CQ1 / CVCC 102059) TaxID=578461 RepID=R0MMQ0_NOSB1|nr:hypothetical protein NBO_3g0046 [Nosema bombycis CQ1]|eukprot:EOB15495.1 hypothetical protein NBO_3g0046 [Nosema bombycis CQ1]